MKNLRLYIVLFLTLVVFSLSRCKKDPAPEPTPFQATPYNLEIPSGFPAPFIPADNPMTVEGVDLGRFLFYDVRVSKDLTMSCASCHNQNGSFTDNEVKSIGIHGQLTRRNSMPIFNLAWQENFFWDGRAVSLEEQALMPVTDKIELDNDWETVVSRFSADSIYPDMFKKAFGDTKITKERVAKAIAQFERSIVSADSKFDRVIRLQTETFSNSEQRGYDIFSSEIGDCFHCHSEVDTRYIMGAFGRDNQFINNGLDTYADQAGDLGREEVTLDTNDRAKFKTSTLRNLSYSFPFMHDGSIPTLDSVVEFYNFGGHKMHSLDPNMKAAGKGRNWTGQQKADLVNFLKTLDDFTFLENPAYSDPFED